MKTKLHPPETAPKDGKMILGDFGYPWLIPSAWNDHDENWVTAVIAAQEMRKGTTDILFENEREKPESLAGWLPMPEKPRKTK